MKSKMEKYRDEREKNAAKIASLKERNGDLDRRIAEVETLEIRALMRSQNLTLDDLVALARARKESNEVPSFTGEQAEAPCE